MSHLASAPRRVRRGSPLLVAWLATAATAIALADVSAASRTTRAPAPVVFVDPAGNDTTGDGSASNPFRTIQKGVDTVDLHGTVRVRPGSYPFAVAITRHVVIEATGAGAIVGP